MKIKYWIIVVSLVCLSGCTAALVSALTPNGGGGSSGLTSLLVLLGLNRPSGGSSSGYSISSAFSYTSNPNGVWSYGWKSTTTGSLTLYSSQLNNSELRSWYYTSDFNPNIAYNNSSTKRFGIAPGETSLTPDTELSVLRWTAPQAGTISIKGSFKEGEVGAVTVYILKNTTTLFSKTSTLVTESYDLTTTVAIGDTIDFQVGQGVATPIDGVIAYTSTAASQVCTVSTLAGSGTAGSTDGTGTAASFKGPYGIAVDNNGNVYVGDNGNYKIRKITSGGVVTTLAGSGSQGQVDGTGTLASFAALQGGLAVDSNGNVYAADVYDICCHKIRKITSGGVVTTLAGSMVGAVDGTGTAASFNGMTAIAIDSNNNIFVHEYGNAKIRKITSSAVVTTYVSFGFSGNPAKGIVVDKNGNIYTSGIGSTISKRTSTGTETTFAGNGNSTSISTDGIASTATFNSPSGIALDSNEVFYIADTGNNKIRKIVCQ